MRRCLLLSFRSSLVVDVLDKSVIRLRNTTEQYMASRTTTPPRWSNRDVNRRSWSIVATQFQLIAKSKTPNCILIQILYLFTNWLLLRVSPVKN